MFEWIRRIINERRERSQRKIEHPEEVVDERIQQAKNFIAQITKLQGHAEQVGITAIEESGKMAANANLEAENWWDRISNMMGKPGKKIFGFVENVAGKIKNSFEDSETLAKTRISVREDLQKQISDDNIPLNNETVREYLILQYPHLVSDKALNDIINKRTKPNTISQAGSEEKGEINISQEELRTAFKHLKAGKPLDNETKNALLKVIQHLSDQSELLFENTTEGIATKEELEEHIKSGEPLKETDDLLLTTMIPGYAHIVNENKTLSAVSEKAQETTSNTVDPWQQFSEKTEKSASKALETWQQFMEKEGSEMLMKLKEKESSKVSKQLQQHGSHLVSTEDNQFHAKESITINNYGKE